MSSLSIWIYSLLAAGSVAVYLLLPPTGRSVRAGGALIGAAALAGVIGLGVKSFNGTATVDLYFYLFSTLALIAAVCVITQTRAVYSALYFIVVVLATAAMVVLLEAEFLAAGLVIIYGGAILVTYIFVIMLAQQAGVALYDRRARAPFGACFAGFLLMAAVAGAMPDVSAPSAAAAEHAAVGNTRALGTLLLTRYVVVLEVAGVLLLIAMIGAIAIARKAFPKSEREMVSEYKPGEAGRSAAPF